MDGLSLAWLLQDTPLEAEGCLTAAVPSYWTRLFQAGKCFFGGSLYTALLGGTGASA